MRFHIGEMPKFADLRIEAMQTALEADHESAAAHGYDERDFVRRRPNAVLSRLRLVTMHVPTRNIDEPQRFIMRHPNGALAKLSTDGADRVD
jgi:hypothetical protein